MHETASATGELRGFGALLDLAHRMHEQRPHCAHAIEACLHKSSELGFGILRICRELDGLRVGAVRSQDGFEQRPFGSERSEQGDFVDAGFDGDEAGRRAAESMLGIDTGGGFQDAFSADHRNRSLVQTDVFASTYLLTLLPFFPLASDPLCTHAPIPPAPRSQEPLPG